MVARFSAKGLKTKLGGASGNCYYAVNFVCIYLHIPEISLVSSTKLLRLSLDLPPLTRI